MPRHHHTSTKPKHWRASFFGLLTLILTLFFAFGASAQTTTTIETYSLPLVCSITDNNLRIGDDDTNKNGAVSVLQNFLYNSDYYPHAGVGEFGWLTLYGLAEFQHDNDLPAFGFFGPMTRGLIYDKYCQTNNSAIIEGTVHGTSAVEIVPAPATTTPNIATSTQNILPYETTQFLDNWKGVWGGVTTTPEGALILKATASTTGAEAFLIETGKDWTDYSYTANVTASINGSVSLVGRYIDGNNFLVCTFSGPSVKITENLNGKKKDVASVKTNIPRPTSMLVDTNYMMKVKGNHVICSATGKDDVSYTLSNSKLLKGGIGISIWHSVPGITSLQLRKVTVTAL